MASTEPVVAAVLSEPNENKKRRVKPVLGPISDEECSYEGQYWCLMDDLEHMYASSDSFDLGAIP